MSMLSTMNHIWYRFSNIEEKSSKEEQEQVQVVIFVAMLRQIHEQYRKNLQVSQVRYKERHDQH